MQFLIDESGQDLIEYALLAGFVGLAGALAWTNIQAGVTSAYTGWGSGVQVLAACTPNPIALGAGCGGK
jgi:Flp pilus assembly pilin Flp